jgi:tRNA dimethylallyltransferase
VLWLGLDLDRALHRTWIERRSQEQFEAGLIDEAAALRARYGPDLRSFDAIGYREAFAVLDGGMTREEAIAEDVRRNVLLAKHQRTWFRREPGIHWLDAADATAFTAASALVRRYLDGG